MRRLSWELLLLRLSVTHTQNLKYIQLQNEKEQNYAESKTQSECDGDSGRWRIKVILFTRWNKVNCLSKCFNVTCEKKIFIFIQNLHGCNLLYLDITQIQVNGSLFFYLSSSYSMLCLLNCWFTCSIVIKLLLFSTWIYLHLPICLLSSF